MSILDLLDGTIPPRRYNIIISRSFPSVKVEPLSMPNRLFDFQLFMAATSRWSDSREEWPIDTHDLTRARGRQLESPWTATRQI